MTLYYIFFFNDTATTEIYTLSLHDALPIFFTEDHGEMNGAHQMQQKGAIHFDEATIVNLTAVVPGGPQGKRTAAVGSDRKSTRLNSSHANISYAVFCLKKKQEPHQPRGPMH